MDGSLGSSLVYGVGLNVLFYFRNHLVEDKGAGCFTSLVFLLSCGCSCSLSLFVVPWTGLWYVIVTFIFWSYLNAF